MKIGSLRALSAYAFHHIGAEAAFPPDSREGELFCWKWDSVFDTGIDVRITLSRRCFVGAVTIALTADSGIREAQLLADGVPAGHFTAGTGRHTGGELTVPAGVYAETLILRLRADLQKIAFPLPEVWGVEEDGEPFLWPVPAKAAFTDGDVILGEIACAHPGNADEAAAARFLRERLEERFGIAPSGAGVPVTVTLDASGAYAGERFTVSVSNDGVFLTAGSRLPLHFAADALLQLGTAGRFRCCGLDDKPYKPMRGFHFMLPPKDQLEFAKRVFRYVLVPLRYNQLIVEFAGGMRFDSHPEISEAWVEGNMKGEAGQQPAFPHGSVSGGRLLEKDEVRDLLDSAREYGMEIIPEVQSLSHVQYITYAHPELAEREEQKYTVGDTRGEDARPADFYAHCYCPSLDASYALIYDLIDEIVDVARPQRYVHMGHDEVYQIGVCPRCRHKDPADLYVKHVTAMHDYLAKKGLGMMIWSDMLQPTERYKTFPAVRRLPKDIVMLDFIWYFHFDLDMEDHILPYGYNVVMGNLYSSHYPRYESRAAKQNMIGGQVSTWCLFNEYTLAKKGKFWDVAYTTEMLWDPDYRECLREAYTMLLARYIQPLQRAELRGTYKPAPATETALPIPAGCSCGVPEAVSALRPATVFADGLACPVNGCYDRLVIEHAALWNRPRISWKDLERLGRYVIRYTDGSSEELPVEYAGNILSWDRRYAQPLPQQYYRHQGYIGTWHADPVVTGKTPDGGDVLICGLVWENPHPGLEILDVTYRAEEGSLSPVMLSGLRGVNL